MSPCIVDLSQDTDDDETLYAYPTSSSRPLAHKLKHVPRSTPTRVAHPASSPSSSVASPPSRKVQAHITNFFSSPRVRQTLFEPTRKMAPPKVQAYPVIHFGRAQLDVADEAPVPEPFVVQVEEGGTATKHTRPIFVPGVDMVMAEPAAPGSQTSPIAINPSPPPSRYHGRSSSGAGATSSGPNLIYPASFSSAGGGCRGPQKRRHSNSEKTPPSLIKSSRRKTNLLVSASTTATPPAFYYNPLPTQPKPSLGNSSSGVAKRFQSVDMPKHKTSPTSSSHAAHLQNSFRYQNGPGSSSNPPGAHRTNIIFSGITTASKPLPQSSLFLSDSDDNSLYAPPAHCRAGAQSSSSAMELDPAPAKSGCTVHADPDCDDVDCVADFFVEYSPFHDTLPDEDEGSRREYKQEQKRAKPALPPPQVEHVDWDRRVREYLKCDVAADTISDKPYLSVRALAWLKEVRSDRDAWMDLFKGNDGRVIHVPYSHKECLYLGRTVFDFLEQHPTSVTDLPAACESGSATEDLHNYLRVAFKDFGQEALEHIYSKGLRPPMYLLPGRTRASLTLFLLDTTYSLPDPDATILVCDLSQGAPKRRTRNELRMLMELGAPPRGMTASETRAPKIKGLFRPTWHFSEGSSDILDIQWSPDGSRFGMASACFSDGYNRPGNLMLGTSDPWAVKMLYRHAFKLKQESMEKFKYATVSSVRFSNEGTFFYSAGYDGFVKTWDGKSGQWITDVFLGGEVMTMGTSHNHDRVIAGAKKDGGVQMIRLNEGGMLDSMTFLYYDKPEEEKFHLYASCLVFGNKQWENRIITGWDTSKDGANYGGLAIFDIVTGQAITMPEKDKRRKMHAARHFDIAMHQESSCFATASQWKGQAKLSAGIHSVVKVFDMRDLRNQVLLKSPQRDINKVTISPCQRYLTASGTGGSTLVWDVRHPNKHMVELKHDVSKIPIGEHTDLEVDDTGVTVAIWGPGHDRFYTGSSDGIVKEWDITSGTPFIQDIAKVDTQIMSAAFSPSWDELIVGECSGAATLFSTRGDNDVATAKIPVDWSDREEMGSPRDDVPVMDWVAAGSTGGSNSGAAEASAAAHEAEDAADSGVLIARQMVQEGKMWIDGRWAWAT